jgi:acyl-CoA synthetase (NDP forming)
MDPRVDALLLIVPSLFFYKETYDLLPVLTEAVDRYPEKPVVTWLYMPDERLAADFSKRGLVLYPTIERAVKALSRLAAYSQFREGATRF